MSLLSSIRIVKATINQRLYDVTLTVNKGVFIGLVGANGAGKSTLLQLLNGSLQPDRGTVRLGHLNTKNHQHLAAIRSHVALVRSDPVHQILAPTVYEEVAFGLRTQGLAPDIIHRRTQHALEAARLWDVRTIHPFFLSLGEQSRLILAAQIVRDPDFLLLDETTAMLDSRARAESLAYLHDQRARHGFGLVLATHRLEELTTADYIAVLYDQQLVAWGSPRMVMQQVAQTPDWQIAVPFLAHGTQHSE